MKVIVVGGKGTIGSAVVKELSARHEVFTACRNGGHLNCDITSEESIRKMYEQAGPFDAVIVTTGRTLFEELSQMTAEKFHIGLMNKLMGQVNIVQIGTQYINDKGSFTLTSGILNKDPVKGGSSASMVNGAIEGFVLAAALELPRQIRINAISPTILVESMDAYRPYFLGFDPVPASKVALAYSKSVEGLQTGKVFEVL
jgi:NAD(P)-dependent dehydrogenase (short-subunit alcohol dehydrogenase family)